MSDDAKKPRDLPAKGQQPPKSNDDKATSLPMKDADAIKGGAAKKGNSGPGSQHNQTLRARRASRS